MSRKQKILKRPNLAHCFEGPDGAWVGCWGGCADTRPMPTFWIKRLSDSRHARRLNELPAVS